VQLNSRSRPARSAAGPEIFHAACDVRYTSSPAKGMPQPRLLARRGSLPRRPPSQRDDRAPCLRMRRGGHKRPAARHRRAVPSNTCENNRTPPRGARSDKTGRGLRHLGQPWPSFRTDDFIRRPKTFLTARRNSELVPALAFEISTGLSTYVRGDHRGRDLDVFGDMATRITDTPRRLASL